MLIAGVLCLCAAAVCAAAGLWALTRPREANLVGQARRAMAPTQLAAALMLAAGGVVVLLADPRIALVALIVCTLGALGTVAVGAWQGARFALVRAEAAQAQAGGCGSSCSSCTRTCG